MEKKETEQKLIDYLQGTLQFKVRRTLLGDKEEGQHLQIDYETIETFINNLKRNEELNYQILILYYYQNQTWSFIERELNLSVSQCQRRRNNVLDQLTTLTSRD